MEGDRGTGYTVDNTVVRVQVLGPRVAELVQIHINSEELRQGTHIVELMTRRTRLLTLEFSVQ